MPPHHDSNSVELLPYRRGVGMVILNEAGNIFVGKRVDSKMETWQMPQGGILLGETPSKAAMREMKEEIGSSKGQIICETQKWYSYKLPEFLVQRLWDGQYRGQKQKWFLIRYHGTDAEINLNTDTPEFREWRWIEPKLMLDAVVPFKKKLYQAVLNEFKDVMKF